MKSEAETTVQYILLVRPETPAQRWHATLEQPGQRQRLEFENPLLLARHLADLALPEPRRGFS